MELVFVARRIQLPLEFEVTSATIGRREAKRNPSVVNAYVRQRGSTVSADMARRAIGLRQFTAWDGEGYTDTNGVHHYMLFGASTGHVITGPSLSTTECLDLLLQAELENPNTFHVIFAGNYDVNMMLKDVPLAKLERLKRAGYCKWNGYTIGYIKGKMFRVKRGPVSITLYDVFTFFGCSFVKALGQYLGEENEDVTRVRLGKSGRATFSYADIDNITAYFESELRLLVRLCDTLRDYLHVAGIRLSKWHGPGAVASEVLRRRGISRVNMPESVSLASQYAYTGGRFEQFKIGKYDREVWQYDIRSAYPAAIATLPSLNGTWVEGNSTRLEQVQDFALYYVTYGSATRNVIHPFAWRYKNGAVFYPPVHGGTWIWGVELRSAILHSPGTVYIHRSLEYVHDGSLPFSWIAEMYNRRAQWKRDKNPAELALKLAMNSIYGKLAQQVGWKLTAAGPKLPKFHQLEYAGYITAYARSKLYAAMSQSPQSLIACETDAVYSSQQLTLDVGAGLGQWEATKYDGIVYVQSGMYFAKEGGTWKHRTRGFGRGDMSVDTVCDFLSGIWSSSDAMCRCDKGAVCTCGAKLAVPQTRFKTMGTSLGKPDWRTWVTANRDIQAGVPGGKREHHSAHCDACIRRTGSMGDTLHDMIPALSLPGVDYTVESTRYPLEWLGQHKQYVEDNDDVWQDEVYD